MPEDKTENRRISVGNPFEKDIGLIIERKAEEVLNELRPDLRADGGEVELISVENGILKVRFRGTCANCPMSNMTLKWGIEPLMKERVPEIRKVEQVE